MLSAISLATAGDRRPMSQCAVARAQLRYSSDPPERDARCGERLTVTVSGAPLWARPLHCEVGMTVSTRWCLAPQFKPRTITYASSAATKNTKSIQAYALEVSIMVRYTSTSTGRRSTLSEARPCPRIDVLLEFPDANAARDPHNVDGKCHVSLPRATKFLTDDPPKDRRNGLTEETHHDERHQDCNCQSAGSSARSITPAPFGSD